MKPHVKEKNGNQRRMRKHAKAIKTILKNKKRKISAKAIYYL